MKLAAIATVITLVAALAANAKTPHPASPSLPENPETGTYEYQEVVTVEGVTAAALYARAKAFVANAYRSTKAVTDLDEPSDGRLATIGSFVVPHLLGNTVTVEHKLTIEVKDGRYRYSLGGFQGIWPNGERASLEANGLININKIRLHTAEKSEALIASLRAAMEHPPKDW